jgi:PadR family transcriptional regulator PadR
MMKMRAFDQAVLEVVRELGTGAYGVTILEALDKKLGREVILGEIYVAIDRLKEAGLVNTYPGAATPERGGRPRLMVLAVPQSAK